MVLFATVRANGAVWAPLIILCIGLVPVRFGFILGAQSWLGADSIWLSFPVSSIANLALSVAYYAQGGWRKARMAIEPAPTMRNAPRKRSPRASPAAHSTRLVSAVAAGARRAADDHDRFLIPLSACAAAASSPWMRAMLAEHRLHPSDFIWPLFVCEGRACEEPIGSLPGVSRWSVDRLAAKAREAADLGIPCIALFPNTPDKLRTEDAAEALNAENLICRAIRAIKDGVPEVGVLTDVALDPYTAHGHDGLTDEAGNVINDDTVKVLAEQALVQAQAGADIVAPSDMMDGRVAAIRATLEREGHHDVAIMAYAAKYASAFYGPFREAVGSQGRLKGDKRGYQMDPANVAEALREVALDLAEGADMVMVKPGLPYLDVVARVKDRFGVPVFAYQVSGEYAMIEAAAAAGAGERDALILETLMAFKRAGATGVLTYHALDAARLISA